MVIKIVEHNSKEYEQMIQLRLRVLLQPIGVPASYIQPDKEAADIFIGAFDHEKIIGCCVLTDRGGSQVQLRQMAVAAGRQGKGVGAAIVAFAEDVARSKGYKTLMMHARDAVLPFYERCGYAIDGEQFFEVGIPHHKMQKQL